MKQVSLTILLVVLLTVKGSNESVEILLNQAKNYDFNDQNNNQSLKNVENDLKDGIESHEGTISKFKGLIDSEGKSTVTQIAEDAKIQSHRPLTLPSPLSFLPNPQLNQKIATERNKISYRNSTQNSNNDNDQSSTLTLNLMPINTPLEREEVKIIEESQPKVNQVRQKLQQSQIYIKLKKKQNYIGKNIETLNLTYYNESSLGYDSFILFHEKSEATFNISAYYFLDQKNRTITLTQQIDNNGNVIYRNLKFNFTLVLYGNSLKQININNNQQLWGSITFEDGNFDAQYQLNAQQSMIFGNSNYIIKSSNTQNNGAANNQKDMGWGQVDNYIDESSYSAYAYDLNRQINNGSFNYSTGKSSDTRTQNNDNLNVVFSDGQLSQSSIRDSNSQSQSTSSAERTTLDGEHFNYYHWQDNQNNFADQKSSNDGASIGIQYQTSGFEGNTIKINNYSLTNETQINDNSQASYSKQSGASQAYYGILPGTPLWIYETGIESTGTHQKSVSVNNQTSSLNETHENSQYINGNSQSETYTETQKENGWEPYSDQNLVHNANHTHIEEVNNNGESFTIETIDGTTANSQIDITEDEKPYTDKTQHHTHTSYTDYGESSQQLHQLRGSKKATGQWKKLNINDSLNDNSQMAEQAISAVQEQFNPQNEGFEFNQILSVQEQIVSGLNYSIQLLYDNSEGNSRIYQVIIYSIPWTNNPDQIVSCSLLSDNASQ